MLEFIMGGNNSHKAEEFQKLFNPKVIQIKMAPGRLDVEENGQSYRENAFLKASAHYKKWGSAILADDSGLEVEALPHVMGIHSARFGGGGLTSKQQCQLLLKEMAGEKNRKAHFCCFLCFYLSDKEIFYFEGRLQGEIAEEMHGEEGFGYDPLFIPAGQKLSLAQLSEWKAINSHRAISCRLAEKFFTERK